MPKEALVLPVLVHIYQTALRVFYRTYTSPVIVQSILPGRHHAPFRGTFMLAEAMERLLWKAFTECNEICWSKK